MGLAGRKTKQVIAPDPRNTTWARDTEAPGFKLLQQMGWSPASSDRLNPESTAPPPPKRLHKMPISKEDHLGIGATALTGLAESNAARQPSTGTGLGKAGSWFSAFGSKGLRFVTAGATAQSELEKRHITDGGDFAGLLARLNAATPSASASPSPAPAATDGEIGPAMSKQERKEARRQRREAKAKRKEIADGDGTAAKKRKVERDSPDVSVLVATVVSRATMQPTVVVATPHRNASRARNLAAKRMANSPAAMREILGLSEPVTPAEAVSPPLMLQAAIRVPSLDEAIRSIAKAEADQAEPDGYALASVEDVSKKRQKTR
ncbi:uncharacterized protein L969DRAFT_48665 [Mixia osmundae IAM 14324]|uniref:G-patch domain-containing protein n=1 Tax=Mixia osmundae (strain CBS 9802 / IAM 14324 / JCM 22182 / KY 12970) TaxID=764103 RepID=G7E8C8_MIXOS|nr:uncharacterized protein L969DRAFT_48665 [Mixia osmundae IAM 14324]KEI39191.1 hypothetical protein L969DRAFT_48665 [Mixia osmundae IAM 14324]GAA99088.1 hypothetical protein E5Q_05777 [Mixia osmundae IAM 14324]